MLLREFPYQHPLMIQYLLAQVLLMTIRYILESASKEIDMFLIGCKHESYRKLLQLYDYIYYVV